MKKIFSVLLCLCACGGGGKTEYPFANACDPEIRYFCGNHGDLAACMFDNFDGLGPVCSGAVFNYAGDVFGWHGNWRDTPRQDRDAFIKGSVAANNGRPSPATGRAQPFGTVGVGTGRSGIGIGTGIGVRL